MLDYIEENTEINEKNKYLMIFLHGWGSDKYDLISLTKDFNSVSKNIHYISVNAPYSCDNGFGYQWFSLKNMDINYIQKEIINCNSILRYFLDFQSKRLNIEYNKIFLVGFSQGSMLSLYNGLTLQKQLAGVIAFSGLLPVTFDNAKNLLTTKQKILMTHGENDNTIIPQLFEYSVEILKKFDFDISYHLLENLGHGINDNCINFAKNFVKNIIF